MDNLMLFGEDCYMELRVNSVCSPLDEVVQFYAASEGVGSMEIFMHVDDIERINTWTTEFLDAFNAFPEEAAEPMDAKLVLDGDDGSAITYIITNLSATTESAVEISLTIPAHLDYGDKAVGMSFEEAQAVHKFLGDYIETVHRLGFANG
jgi:hypothetical protein